ncbi:hypothetical protein [Citrobacter amalonaticus]|uniref:hypothetical protein n=1 Tax=Citrobacter amalonaticus TaxID=35703 RepID=UPI001F2ABABF|nr:hypothetical protein [Citrobacter amalonaticus]
MNTITREQQKQILIDTANHVINRDNTSPYSENLRELARIALASLTAEPVSFDDLRDAVAEVSGGPAMEWSDIYKGHQVVPFINFNSLARIVDKFRAAPASAGGLLFITCRPVTMGDMRFVVCPECGNKRCPRANNHRNACTGSNEPGQEGSAYPAAPQQEMNDG